MEKSFRTILMEHLEPSAAAPAPAFTPSSRASDVPFFHFEVRRPRLTIAPAPRGYRRETELSRARAERLRQPRPEPVIDLARLSAAARADLEWMIARGAGDLREGLNTRRLKTAYRALARRHHPDVNSGGHETFLELRVRYGRLLQTCNSR